MNAYSYTVLRYMHDTTTREFVNVGVVVFSPQGRFLSARCRTTYGRLSKVFPGVNGDHIKSMLSFIQSRIEEIGATYADDLPNLDRASSVDEIVRRVLPHDDSSLQWAPAGSGRSLDLAATTEQLFERLVMRYEAQSGRERRDEAAVWRDFKSTLERRNLLSHFAPHTIRTDVDFHEFDHVWKNGIYHCLEPISFDLSDISGVHDKAHRWLGRLISLADSPDEFQVYFVAAVAQEERVRQAFDDACKILGKCPRKPRIFTEDQAEQLSELLAEQMHPS